MTALALQRRLEGCGVTVSSLHPGVVSTEITRSSEDLKIMKLLIKVDSKIRMLDTHTHTASTNFEDTAGFNRNCFHTM